MIRFFSENNFKLPNKREYKKRIQHLIQNEGFTVGDINYIFCNDGYLLEINQDYLNHDTYTDIITFNYTIDKEIHSDIYISTERVEENAKENAITFEKELERVLYHGVLHLCGYNDKTKEEQKEMRVKEDYYLHLQL